MTPDSMLTTQRMVHSAEESVQEQGWESAWRDLKEQEPMLADYFENRSTMIAGNMALAGAPTNVVQGVYNDIMEITLTAISALRRGHYELWKDTEVGGTLMEMLDEDQIVQEDQINQQEGGEIEAEDLS